jgi:hypothetical protein
MPRIHCTGDTPPAEPRGAVTPPPTRTPALERWMAAYAGLSSLVTYVPGLVGRSQRRWFGSFQISQSFTHGYRVAAAAAKAAKDDPETGAQLGERPPFAQRGVP